MSTLTSVTHISHPFREGHRVEIDNVDALCEFLDTVKHERQRLHTAEILAREAIALMADLEKSTSHVRGEKYTATVTKPKPSWDQAVLRELMAEDPQQSETYLRIARLEPNLREVNMMEKTNGNDRFEAYKKRLLSARQAPRSIPAVSVKPIEVPA